VDILDFGTIHAYPDYWAQRAPGREALVGGGQRLTFRDLRDQARAKAAGLLGLPGRPAEAARPARGPVGRWRPA
jgi:acyl-CoA synthetase (AMP-forming)/AMP-acid ligase II